MAKRIFILASILLTACGNVLACPFPSNVRIEPDLTCVGTTSQVKYDPNEGDPRFHIISITAQTVVDPASGATVSPDNWTVTWNEAGVYSVTMTVSIKSTDGATEITKSDSATKTVTVCKVEIKDGADETKDPGKFLCVGNTITFQAKITPALSGQYDWKITKGGQKAAIEGADNAKVVTNKGLEASKHLDDVAIKLKFKPAGGTDWCSPVFHEFTVLKVDLDAMKVSHNAANGELPEDQETSPGAFVPINNDDDDYDASNAG